MLTSLELENFKGIGARQRIEFAPLTLLFGANSAGKSTVLQALLYLHELLERGSADVDRTELGGDVLELGGFARLVHQHDTERAIVVRAEFTTPAGLERFGRDLSEFPFPDLDDDVESAWLELTIQHRHEPVVRQVRLGVNGEAAPLVWLELGVTMRDPIRARVNLEHSVLVDSRSKSQPALFPMGADPEVVSEWEAVATVTRRQSEFLEELGPGQGNPGETLSFDVARGRASALPHFGEPLRILPFGQEDAAVARTADQIRTFLEMVILGTTAQLAAVLRNVLFVGPLRALPPRGYRPKSQVGSGRWANGLAAWDAIADGKAPDVGHWMKRLGTGYDVRRRDVLEVPDVEQKHWRDLDDITGKVDRFYPPEPLDENDEFYEEDLHEQGFNDVEIMLMRSQVEALRKLGDALDASKRTDRVVLVEERSGLELEPADVGVGISQVVPVVAATVLRWRHGEARPLVCIEQPELHLHPRAQVGLADLFISEALPPQGRGKQFLIETHSEHLVLRLLRRLRQTADGELPRDVHPITPKDLSVIHLEPSATGVQVRKLRVDKQGEFIDRWPSGFFEERIEELL